ncbi:MAG TPA: Bax inhibitor-1/YccA family protein [Caulobacteraceae bacterium]|nr:Bax inhibitor-1/YccA family protein [Caulobacteraceae bacterium]
MSDFNGRYPGAIPAPADMAVDQGLRSFMLGVYSKLFFGLVIATVLAFVTSSVAPVRDMLFQITPDGRFGGYTMLGFGVVFAPLVLILGSSFFMRSATSSSVSLIYWLVVATMGASLGVVLLIYTGASAAMTLGVTAIAFGGLSLVGYTTKKNLSGMGSFLIMALIGLIVASLVNMFLRSPMMHLVISAAGVLIFAGLIAYDTQRLKMTYYAIGGDKEALGVATSYGALSLFINFVNLFQFLLQFLGARR